MEQEFNFESIKNKALEQLKSGKSLLGKDGAFAPLLESILNAALEGEMEAHLSDEERETGNRRNGKMQKQVQTPLGEVTVSTPRDRNSTFDPQFIKKRETILAEGVADRIIGLYALGNSTREISDWMEENLGNRVSAETISSITDRVLPEIKAWKSRLLEPVSNTCLVEPRRVELLSENPSARLSTSVAADLQFPRRSPRRQGRRLR